MQCEKCYKDQSGGRQRACVPHSRKSETAWKKRGDDSWRQRKGQWLPVWHSGISLGLNGCEAREGTLAPCSGEPVSPRAPHPRITDSRQSQISSTVHIHLSKKPMRSKHQGGSPSNSGLHTTSLTLLGAGRWVGRPFTHAEIESSLTPVKTELSISYHLIFKNWSKKYYAIFLSMRISGSRIKLTT